MRNDPLMKAIADLATEEAAVDPRLESYAAGQLSSAELATLEAEARDNPGLARALEAYRPLSDEEAERLVAASVEAYEASLPDNVVVFPRRQFAVGGLVAAAAAAALFVFVPGSDPSTPLPEYGYELIGGDRDFRGANDAPSPEAMEKFSPTSRVELRVRPQVAVTGKAALAAYFEVDGALRPIDGRIEASDQGAFRIVGVAGDLFDGEVGVARLIFVVARERALPDLAAVQAVANGGAPAEGVQVLEDRIRLLP